MPPIVKKCPQLKKHFQIPLTDLALLPPIWKKLKIKIKKEMPPIKKSF